MVEALARGEGGGIPLLAMSTTHEFIRAAFELVEELGLDEELGGCTALYSFLRLAISDSPYTLTELSVFLMNPLSTQIGRAHV